MTDNQKSTYIANKPTKESYKAIIIGSSGMVGTQVLDLLLSSEKYTEVLSLVRRKSTISHPKLSEHVIDFDQPETWEHLVKGDVLFSCLGTTIAKAKSTQNQFKVDYTYQYQIAEMAAKQGVSTYALISSAGANANSKAFYMQTKGKLDAAVMRLGFRTLIILRPGQLYGARTEKRLGESFGLTVMFALNKLGILKKYRPIHAREVAQSLLNAVALKKTRVYKLSELFDLLQ
jgi:uncharacterized protein YbjT (DUF2867 family)